MTLITFTWAHLLFSTSFIYLTTFFSLSFKFIFPFVQSLFFIMLISFPPLKVSSSKPILMEFVRLNHYFAFPEGRPFNPSDCWSENSFRSIIFPASLIFLAILSFLYCRVDFAVSEYLEFIYYFIHLLRVPLISFHILLFGSEVLSYFMVIKNLQWIILLVW